MLEVVNKKDNALIVRFNSQQELIEYIDGRCYDGSYDNDWLGRGDVNTWQEMLSATQRSWEDGLLILKRFVNRLKNVEIPRLKSRKRETNYGAEGEDIDIDRMLAGDDNFWKTTRREVNEGGHTVTVFIDTSTPYHHRSDDILWRGAVAIATAMILEEAGLQTELWVVNGTRLFMGKDRPVMTAVRLKEPSDPIDESTFVNVVSGWFYRTNTFSLMSCICQDHNETKAFGFGNCFTPRAIDLDLLSTDMNRIYASGVFTFDGAVRMMEYELEKFAGLTKVEQSDG